MNDNLIIKKVLEGNIEEFSYLIDKYKDMIFSISYRVLGNCEDSEEVTQDVFIKAFKLLNKHKMTAKFSNWIYRIAYTTSISRLRTNKYNNNGKTNIKNNIENKFDLNQASTYIENKESDQIVADVLNKLDTEDKLLISLYYYNDCTIKDISIIVGLKESNVKVRLYRIRKKLYRYFSKNDIIDIL